MHELSITRNIVAIASDHAASRRVRRITLRVGMLAGVAVDAIQFCFDVAARNTPCEGARLEIEAVDGKAHCHGCDADFFLPAFGARCPCGSSDYAIAAGTELSVYQIETERA